VRHDFYGPIHKALRFALSNLLVKVGQTDFTDDAAMDETLMALGRQLSISASHLRHEEEYVHGALEARSGGATDALESAHRHHDETFGELNDLMSLMKTVPASARPAVGREIYLRFSQFVADDFAHMAHEELVTMPLLHSLFSDQELIEIEGRIIASHTPEETMAVMQILLPAMNRSERVGFLSMARQAAPPEAFDAVINFAAKPTLDREDFLHLTEGLGLAA
jgi:iron-sulfur cluster repair protein YtfE (RIC family)